jgi:RNA polymerase sigma-70 factor, ECF subfamily
MNYSVDMVWNAFHEPLERFIRKRVSDEQIAADLLQDVYIKVHTHIDMLRQEDRLQSWIYQIARNTIYDHYRSHKPALIVSETLAAPETIETNDDFTPRLAHMVFSMIDYLPEEYQVALRLTELEGITQQELAQQLGLSLSGAKSRVQRGRKLLRTAVLTCCQLEFDRRGKVIDYCPRR